MVVFWGANSTVAGAKGPTTILTFRQRPWARVASFGRRWRRDFPALVCKVKVDS